MMKKMYRLFLTAVVVVACVGMWGCMGCSDEKVVDRGVSVGRHFYIVNDSTIMLDFFNWETIEFYSSYIQGSDEETRVVDDFALVVSVNRDSIYDKVYFPETKTKNFLDQVMKNLIFYFTPEEDNHFNIVMLAGWKFPNEKKVFYINSATNYIDSTDYLTENQNEILKDKKIFSIHDGSWNMEFESRQFFIWDVAKNTFAKWKPTGASAWISDCKDIQWTEKHFRCLKDKDGYVHVLNEMQESLDSLKIAGCGIDRCYSFGIRFYGNYIGVGHPIYKIISVR